MRTSANIRGASYPLVAGPMTCFAIHVPRLETLSGPVSSRVQKVCDTSLPQSIGCGCKAIGVIIQRAGRATYE